MKKLILIVTLCLGFSYSFAEEAPPKGIDQSYFLPQNLDRKKEVEAEDHANLLPYRPIYFIYGNPTSKFQFSFRLRAIKDSHLFFGYSQMSFWDLTKTSAPFRDSTYNPEIFYTWDLQKKVFLDTIDFGFFEHNSNGKDKAASRSFNRSYVRFNFARESDLYIFKFSTKVSAMHEVGDLNANIRDYIGPLELSGSVTKLFNKSIVDRAELNVRYFPGGRWLNELGKGGTEVGLVARFGGISFLPALYFQYYRGYAESLLFYDQKVSHFKVGLIF